MRAVTIAVFAICGGLAAFAGLLMTSRLHVGQPTAAQGLELDAIAAVVLGGTSLFGGRGSVVGTAVAVMLLQVLRNIFNLLGLGSFYQMAITARFFIMCAATSPLSWPLPTRWRPGLNTMTRRCSRCITNCTAGAMHGRAVVPGRT